MGRRVRYTLPFVAVVFLVCALLATSGSWLIARKVIALLILPVGVVWLALIALALWPGLPKKLRIAFGVLCVVYTMAGSPYIGTALLRTLEAPYLSFENSQQEFDAIVLLGGGT